MSRAGCVSQLRTNLKLIPKRGEKLRPSQLDPRAGRSFTSHCPLRDSYRQLPFVGRLGRLLQLIIGLIQQFLRLLSVTSQIKFIGALRVLDSLKRLSAEPLRGREVGMACPRNVARRSLSHGHPSDCE